jgi:hypothetical protein
LKVILLGSLLAKYCLGELRKKRKWWRRQGQSKVHQEI